VALAGCGGASAKHGEAAKSSQLSTSLESVVRAGPDSVNLARP
jgi:hypothetical protein